MSWLSWTHLRPAVRGGQSPDQADVLPLEAIRLAPIRWQILLNQQVLGWASHDVERSEDGQGQVNSTVRIERLSMEQVFQQGFGSLGSLLTRGLSAEAEAGLSPISLTIENSMHFDHYGQLESFESVVVEDEWGECIRLTGTVRESQLLVKAYLVWGDDDGQASREPVFQKVLTLPPDKLVVDSLAPRPRLSNLRVGQRWTFESYHPFFPTRPLQTIEAVVQERRALRIEGQDVWTFRVAYLRGVDDGLSLDRHVGDVYVKDDGTVIRQTLTWGNVTLTFNRLPSGSTPTDDVSSDFTN